MHFRKNKQQTQRTIASINDFLKGRMAEYVDHGVTTLQSFYDKKSGYSRLNIFLFGERIVELIMKDDKPYRFYIFSGDTFDRYGNLTSSVKERLNGILNFLGNKKMIPEGIIAYLDKDCGVSYIGKDSERVPFGQFYSRIVSIEPDPINLTLNDLTEKAFQVTSNAN